VKNGEHRQQVEYVINDEQAAVVRELFERYASGQGLRSVARELNGRGVPSARAGRRGTGSWAPSAIFPILRRGRYIGASSGTGPRRRTAEEPRCATSARTRSSSALMRRTFASRHKSCGSRFNARFKGT
jgi:hypothetical protein